LYVGTRKTQGKAVAFVSHHAAQNSLCMSQKTGCKTAALHALIRGLEPSPVLVVGLSLAAAGAGLKAQHSLIMLAFDKIL
jgi:hypothetical protein